VDDLREKEYFKSTEISRVKLINFLDIVAEHL
jgi:hypothetical protein